MKEASCRYPASELASDVKRLELAEAALSGE